MNSSKKLLDIYFYAKNSEDTGKCGRWAIDNARIDVIAWKLPGGEISVSVEINGTWNTIKGARTPNGDCEQLQQQDATGKIIESLSAKLPVGTKVILEKTRGFIGTYDLEGTYCDLLLPQDEQKGSIPLVTILNSFFTNPIEIISVIGYYYLCDKLLMVDNGVIRIGNVKIEKDC